MGFDKDPEAVLDYVFDWTKWLALDTITAHTVTVAPAGLTINSTSATTTKVTVWLAAGVLGKKYKVTCRVTTAGGRTNDETMLIVVRSQ